MSQRMFYALGTASQVPTKKRNHGGYFLRWDQEGFLLDPGEGTQRQMAYAGISANDITKILITHFHGDHCLGLSGVFQRLSLHQVNHTIEIYFPSYGSKYIKNLREASHFHDVIKIKECPIEEEGILFSTPQLTLKTKRLEHSLESFGFQLIEADSANIEKDKVDALGLSGPQIGQLKREGSLLLNDKTISLETVSRKKPGQRFSFIMDTRLCKAAIDLATHADVLVTESTFLSEHQDQAINHGHLTAKDAAHIAKESGAGLLLLTHFSQRYGETSQFEMEAKDDFSNVIALNDGDVINVRLKKKWNPFDKRCHIN